MNDVSLEIEKDITKASTLPGTYYKDLEYFERSKEDIFASSWQLLSDSESVRVPGQVQPITFLDGLLNEPLLLARDYDDKIHCVSNVCTHRANLVIEKGGIEKSLRCRYHGRKFGLDGSFLSMPECEKASNFPCDSDNLPKVAFDLFGRFIFASLNPKFPFSELVSEMERRVGWIPTSEFRFDSSRSRDYLVNAHWALYCDNYLEGFHIPYIHAGLNSVLDYGSYRTEIFRYSSLQVGVAKDGESCFELPKSSPDYGASIGAYYFWLFPNMMFNFYPWGLSINIVKPLAIDRTKISYLTYVWDEAKLDKGAGSSLDRVEREDEAVVENVQKGVSSRLYRKGRFSPTQEQGTHHFHRLISEFHSVR